MDARCTTTAGESAWIEDTGFRLVKEGKAPARLLPNAGVAQEDVTDCSFWETSGEEEPTSYREIHAECLTAFDGGKIKYAFGRFVSLNAEPGEDSILDWNEPAGRQDEVFLGAADQSFSCNLFIKKPQIPLPSEPEVSETVIPQKNPASSIMVVQPSLEIVCENPNWYPIKKTGQTAEFVYNKERQTLSFLLDRKARLRSDGPCTLRALDRDGKTEVPLQVACGDPETRFSLPHLFETQGGWTVLPSNGQVLYDEAAMKKNRVETLPERSFCAAAPLSVAQPFRKPQP